MKTLVSFLNPDFIKTSSIGGLTARGKDAAGLCFQRSPGRLAPELQTLTLGRDHEKGIYLFD